MGAGKGRLALGRGPKCVNAKPNEDEARSNPSVGLSFSVVQRGVGLEVSLGPPGLLWARTWREACGQQRAWLARLLEVSPPSPWPCTSVWAALKGACSCSLSRQSPFYRLGPQNQQPLGCGLPHLHVVRDTGQAVDGSPQEKLFL